jgi:dynein intermediate chain 1
LLRIKLHAFSGTRLNFSDFRFWEDASDEFRETEGTLLPLWNFNFERARNLEITSLCWNAAYKDLFAAGFGSCEFKSKPQISL